MKLIDILEEKSFVRGQTLHPEIKYPSMYDNTTNWGITKRVNTKDVVVRDSKTKTIYGRRQIVQRES